MALDHRDSWLGTLRLQMSSHLCFLYNQTKSSNSTGESDQNGKTIKGKIGNHSNRFLLSSIVKVLCQLAVLFHSKSGTLDGGLTQRL